MRNFIKIRTVYNSERDRIITQLAQIYEDYNVLKDFVSSILDRDSSIDTFSKKRILVKPNWVKHDSKPNDKLCLRTHENFILATLEIILSFEPSSVIIGDAPIQGCKWNRMLSKYFVDETVRLSKYFKIPVILKDFRRTVFYPEENKLDSERKSLDDYMIFDMGSKSFLEPVSPERKSVFRVTDYDPDRLAMSHKKGVHKYCITKELFKADLILSMPKVKTHQKAGITAALKNLVGLNGDKDFLPHHRIGGTGFGGDCYPGKNYLRYGSELILDLANRNRGKFIYKFLRRTGYLTWKLSFPGEEHDLAAAWFGNDTTWRMVMDLNTIALYGKESGKIANTPQRKIYSLCDGIIGGEGDGPLNPEPLNLGIISFSDNSYLTDLCMGVLMGLKIEKIPLLRYAKKMVNLKTSRIYFNDNEISFLDLKKYSVNAKLPPGWKRYEEAEWDL